MDYNSFWNRWSSTPELLPLWGMEIVACSVSIMTPRHIWLLYLEEPASFAHGYVLCKDSCKFFVTSEMPSNS